MRTHGRLADLPSIGEHEARRPQPVDQEKEHDHGREAIGHRNDDAGHRAHNAEAAVYSPGPGDEIAIERPKEGSRFRSIISMLFYCKPGGGTKKRKNYFLREFLCRSS